MVGRLRMAHQVKRLFGFKLMLIHHILKRFSEDMDKGGVFGDMQAVIIRVSNKDNTISMQSYISRSILTSHQTKDINDFIDSY